MNVCTLNPKSFPMSAVIVWVEQRSSNKDFIHHFLFSPEEMLCFITTLAIGHLPPLDMYWLIVPALRTFEAAVPGLQHPLAEMAVPASSSIKLAVKRWCRRRQSGSRR